MVYRYFAAALLLLATVPASADDWRSEDTYREAAYLTLHAIDWGQTLDIADKCGHTDYHEHNPILGECPSRSRVNAYFATSAILHYAVSQSLPPKYRKTWQHVTIGVEVGAVANNISIGLNVGF